MTRPLVKGILFSLTLIAGSALLFIGCEIDSAESGSRNVSINVTGWYRYSTVDGGANLVDRNSGAPIRSLDLRQSGDGLEGVDNNGSIWRGSIGQVNGSVASFTLEGFNSIGQEGTWSGTIEVTKDFEGRMRGTYIEAGLFSTIYGVATVPSNTSQGVTYTLKTDVNPDGAGSISPSGGTYPSGTTVNLTATAAAGYTFSAWGGVTTTSDTDATVLMDGNKTVTATFTVTP